MTLLLAAIIGYLLGSIPFGLVITRIAGLGDVRDIGSGNIGTTNVLRTGRKELAALTLIGDMLKGTLAVWIASHWGFSAMLVAGFCAFLGHLFPVWLGFKGGKGVATYLGILLGAVPFAALAFALIWLSMAAIKRYSSLAALTASALTPLVVFAETSAVAPTLAFALMSAILWYAHRANLARLRAGTEARISAK